MAKDAKRRGWRNVDGGGEVGASKEERKWMDGRSIVVVRGGDRNSRHWNLAEEEEIMEWNECRERKRYYC